MSAVVEFQAQVKDGVIVIPEQYKSSLNQAQDVRVILVQQNSKPTNDADFLTELLENPVVMADFVPLTRDEMYER
ncbi:hypothetical protein IQ266_14645 [filamentous cyanobacterium LEGE 11480]|uniref:Uncharacterized protein n=1 Tax=Romeriopsis navalis LEGE 11480 TaxID=2777977 RepID=A0A928VQB8_9CYAN|nr:hypothetical protein [Romeriopsis navalis]MBE9030971.1 hypothetical protein [Romeriopsis navalis LEGE 11480]